MSDVMTAGEIVLASMGVIALRDTRTEIVQSSSLAGAPSRKLSQVCLDLIAHSDRDADWRPGIPGRIGVLNDRVQDVLNWHDVHPVQRGRMAAALIEEKVRQAYHQMLAP